MSLQGRQALDGATKGVLVALVSGLVGAVFGVVFGVPAVTLIASAVAAGLTTGVLFLRRSPAEIEADRRMERAETTVDKMDRHARRQRRPYQTGGTVNRTGDDYY